ncbi:MAG TPA: ABC transporter ATP-binding protein [candidate division Zixibacteria bacterium]|nr:ABC transporter ATP-binding protein [candidate division Zixibacteria bacterium]
MHPLVRILSYIKSKTWFAIAVVIFSALLDTAFTLITPYIVKEIINGIFYGTDLNYRLWLLRLWVPIYIAVGFLAAIFRFLQRYINEYVSQTVIFDLRNSLYSKIQKQSIDFFDRMETGQLISRGTSDVEAIRRLLSIGLRIFLRAICLYTGIFIIIGLMDWRLLLIVAGAAPIMFISMFSYARRVRPLMSQIQNKFGDMNNILAENVYGSRVVRAFAAENFESMKFEKENEFYLELNMKLARLRAFITTLYPFILTIGSFLLLLFGGRAIINGTLEGGVGTLVAINSYLVLLQMPTRFMSFAILHYQEGTASLNRIFEVIDMEKKIVEKSDAVEIEDIKGEIEFKNVTFTYVEGNPPVLKNVNLKINQGETIAFLGTTGSGKSTIVSLVPRFYDPQEGSVLIDGVNLQDLKLDSFRKQIAIVQQEAFLFARTIKENIAFGKPDALEEEIIRVSKIAQAHDFIMSFPGGYDTVVGERGITLSGGQKQRLTIARALLLQSPILIMDDSSSALDFETESQFQKAVGELVKNKTTLIVTQRLSTIKFATRIIVMDGGEIVESGKHNELMALGGLYKHLYETQLIDKDDTLISARMIASSEISSSADELGGQK